MSIVHDDDLPAGMKARQKIAHDIAQQSCEQVWNIAIDAEKQIGLQISGNEALSYMGTICFRRVVCQDLDKAIIVWNGGIPKDEDYAVIKCDGELIETEIIKHE